MANHWKAVGVLGTLLPFFFSSCGSSREPESVGVIGIVDGVVRQLSMEEQEELCSQQYCEPNYTYSIHFGPKKPKSPDPQPDPEPPPSDPDPNPDPDPDPDPNPDPDPEPPAPVMKDALDYSADIVNQREAWELSEGNEEIVVAVIDTGVDYNHPDLRDNIWKNWEEANGLPGVDDDANGYVDDVYGYDFYNNRPNGLDDNKHGTHVSGILGAVKNDEGVVGMAPKVRIMPLKFMDHRGYGGTSLRAIAAIEYAIANGADIINTSWSSPYYSTFLERTVQKAQDNGIMFVASAGNRGESNERFPRYPATYEGVVAVASTDEKDRISSFSNYGWRTVLVGAPGSNILSTVLDGDYDEMSGSSMSTPKVAGAFVLAMALRPELSNEELKSLLCESAEKRWLSRLECGRLDVHEFLKRVNAFESLTPAT